MINFMLKSIGCTLVVRVASIEQRHQYIHGDVNEEASELVLIKRRFTTRSDTNTAGHWHRCLSRISPTEAGFAARIPPASALRSVRYPACELP